MSENAYRFAGLILGMIIVWISGRNDAISSLIGGFVGAAIGQFLWWKKSKKVKSSKGESLPIQKRVIKALEMGDAQKVEALIGALEDENGHTRLDAVRALGEIKDKNAVESLIIRLLRDKEDYVRWNAAEALGKLMDIKAIEPLIFALKDEHMLVRKDAAKALSAITQIDLGEDPIKWNDWWEKNKSQTLETLFPLGCNYPK